MNRRRILPTGILAACALALTCVYAASAEPSQTASQQLKCPNDQYVDSEIDFLADNLPAGITLTEAVTTAGKSPMLRAVREDAGARSRGLSAVPDDVAAAQSIAKVAGEGTSTEWVRYMSPAGDTVEALVGFEKVGTSSWVPARTKECAS